MFNYEFKNKKLLENALSHTSYIHERKLEHIRSNERLEFLGDSVLSVIVSTYLYKTYPSVDEGELTRIRASVVCEGTLAILANQIGLPNSVLLGKGEAQGGGAGRASILSDAFEAVLAAIFLDSDLETARQWLLALIIPQIELATQNKLMRDFKTALQEFSQKGDVGKITYKTIKEEGPDHSKHFTVEAYMDGEYISTGTGSSKKESEQTAAKMALESVQTKK